MAEAHSRFFARSFQFFTISFLRFFCFQSRHFFLEFSCKFLLFLSVLSVWFILSCIFVFAVKGIGVQLRVLLAFFMQWLTYSPRASMDKSRILIRDMVFGIQTGIKWSDWQILLDRYERISFEPGYQPTLRPDHQYQTVKEGSWPIQLPYIPPDSTIADNYVRYQNSAGIEMESARNPPRPAKRSRIQSDSDSFFGKDSGQSEGLEDI
jgi:hypothetical protein